MRDIDRRQLLSRAAASGGALAWTTLLPRWARSASPGLSGGQPTPAGGDIDLAVSHGHLPVDGRHGHVVMVNGTVPGPLLRLREGQGFRIRVRNDLAEDTSIHWHGILAPSAMDGVPGLSFAGIKPGRTFVYDLPIRQSGTYWYHSHSGMQEQEGHYGPIVIDPAGGDPVRADREHLVVLSDFSFIHPHRIFSRLKQDAEYFNHRQETVAGLLAGRDQPLSERVRWARMRMNPTDIADVTGAAYSYVINGHGPRDNWTGLFRPGEQVRLRFINAAAQTIFDVRIPGLKLTIVAADGQDVRPVEVDEFQIGSAETYDVIVQPAEDKAFTLVAEASDRSGMARATLAPRPGMTAPIPPLRARPLASMKDMGMDMSSMNMPGMDISKMDMSGTGGTKMSMRDPANAPGVALGPGVQALSPMALDRTGEPGQGLEGDDGRVLTYRDLTAVTPNPDTRPPSRSLDIHLTGNMQRFIWGFDGRTFSEGPRPYAFRAGERVRVTLINDTMMAHPIHLHGHFFELASGPAGFRARKHTVTVAPGGTVAWDFTATPGEWAFHCHMLYHMHAGMFQVFSVGPGEGEAA
jgi:CopA family copper-resistance protein